MLLKYSVFIQNDNVINIINKKNFSLKMYAFICELHVYVVYKSSILLNNPFKTRNRKIVLFISAETVYRLKHFWDIIHTLPDQQVLCVYIFTGVGVNVIATQGCVESKRSLLKGFVHSVFEFSNWML